MSHDYTGGRNTSRLHRCKALLFTEPETVPKHLQVWRAHEPANKTNNISEIRSSSHHGIHYRSNNTSIRRICRNRTKEWTWIYC